MSATTDTSRIFGLFSQFPPIRRIEATGTDGQEYLPHQDERMFYIDVPGNDSYLVNIVTSDGVLSYPNTYVANGSDKMLTPDMATATGG